MNKKDIICELCGKIMIIDREYTIKKKYYIFYKCNSCNSIVESVTEF